MNDFRLNKVENTKRNTDIRLSNVGAIQYVAPIDVSLLKGIIEIVNS